MRVTGVVDLERETVLKPVTQLFVGQPVHNRGPVADIQYAQACRFRERSGGLFKLCRRGRAMCVRASVELGGRADVAQLPHSVVPVVVRKAVRVGDRARGLPEQRGGSGGRRRNTASTRRSSVSGTIFRRAVPWYGSGSPFAR